MTKRMDNAAGLPEEIRLTDAVVCFDGRRVLNGLNARIPFSGTTVVSGPSGCGKTTLLRVLMGLQRLDSGSITGLMGRRLSVVFQEDRLLPWLTALENVALVSDADNAKRYLTALGLGEALMQKPAALSGGMKRRVAIARALAFGGDMLLLDEPFTGLDEAARAQAARILLESGKPLLLVTHSGEEGALLRAETDIPLS